MKLSIEFIEVNESRCIPMSKKKSDSTSNNPLQSSAKGSPSKYTLRAPKKYPEYNQWQVEGCQDTLSKLSKDEKTFYLEFLESYYGGNEDDLYMIPNESLKESRANRYNNRADVMTVIGTRDKVQLENYITNNYQPTIDQRVSPSKLQEREYQHIDLCNPNNPGAVEDAMIALLDSQLEDPPLTKKQRIEIRKARIKKRMNSKR